MTGIYWRLLAVFSLIFITPTFLRGQDAAADRSRVLTSGLTTSPKPPRYSAPLAPVWIPPPRLTNPDPVAPGTVGLQPIFFSQMVRSAGIIFSGRVTAVGRAPSFPGQARPSTSVTFQVERATRGTAAGRRLTIHEWAGLWSSGERYRVGERVLLFLYSPSKLGLTSPVDGGMGRFAMDSQGRVALSARHAAALADDRILGGKTVVPYAVFIQAVRRSGGEE